MRVSNLFAIKTFLCILLKTSAQCGFVTMCFISCLQFLTSHKAAFYRCRSDGELVGSVAYFAGQSSAPDGWVLCDGSAVSRTTYATLFAAVGTTYGTGDGSTTFALPNLIDKFVEGSATAGTAKSAGLPNITGTMVFRPITYNNVLLANGVFFRSEGSVRDPATVTSSTGQKEEHVSMDASRSSSIYGNSSTVQPPALTMKPFIYTGKKSIKKWVRTV